MKHKRPDRTTDTTGGAFLGARLGFHCISVQRVTKSRFVAMCCYKGEILVDAMVQTRGQQSGAPGRGALRGVTAEGDAVATTVSSGSTLKHAVSAPSTEHNAAVLAGGGSGWEELVSPLGVGSPIQSA